MSTIVKRKDYDFEGFKVVTVLSSNLEHGKYGILIYALDTIDNMYIFHDESKALLFFDNINEKMLKDLYAEHQPTDINSEYNFYSIYLN
jgi:hypothetical protein